MSEYLRTKVKLTLNRDYANHFFIIGLASISCTQTPINEINILPRNSEVHIDIASRDLKVEYVNYHENTVPLNSREGLNILDSWFVRWTRLFRNIYSHTHNIKIDLSGGMDSRLNFALFLNSGIDLNRVCINSNKSKKVLEDYKIASEIVEHFGLTLNNQENFTGGQLNFSLEDSINISLYTGLAVHKQLQFIRQKCEDFVYHISGDYGEVIKGYYEDSFDDFIKKILYRSRFFARQVRDDINSSMKKVLSLTLERVSKEMNINVENFSEIKLQLYRDARGRFHFGTANAARFMANVFVLCPLIDCELQKLKLNFAIEEHKKEHLLTALIYTRYCPELLKFNFANGKTIDNATIAAAEKISAEFPRDEKIFTAVDTREEFHVNIRDTEISCLLQHNNQLLDKGSPQQYLKKIFDTTKLRKLFATCFDEEIYVFAEEYSRRIKRGTFAECSAILAIARAIQDVMISAGSQNTMIDELKELSQSEFVSSSDKFTWKFLRLRMLLRVGVVLFSFPKKLLRKVLKVGGIVK